MTKRIYIFEVDDSPSGMKAGLIDAPSSSRPNDFRTIIALCCTLILRWGVDLTPELTEIIKRIQFETGLIARLD